MSARGVGVRRGARAVLALAVAGLAGGAAVGPAVARAVRPLAAPAPAAPVVTSPQLRLAGLLQAAGAGPGATAGTPLALAPARPGAPAPVLHATALDAIVLRAYRQASATVHTTDPTCGISWPVLAGIGRIESDNGRDVPAGGGITAQGTLTPPILGPALDGTHGNAAIKDGTAWARATGPLQFIPSTWARWGADGNGDGKADPNNVFDAALGAAHYLCAGGRVLTDPVQLAAAVFSYDHSESYVATVLGLVAAYAHEDAATLLAAAGIPTAPTPAASASPTPSATPAPSKSPTRPVPTRTAPGSPSQTGPAASGGPTGSSSSTAPDPTAPAGGPTATSPAPGGPDPSGSDPAGPSAPATTSPSADASGDSAPA